MAFLKVTDKSIERYVKRGQLKIAETIKPATGGRPVPMFARSELERFKVASTPHVEPTEPTEETEPTGEPTGSTALQPLGIPTDPTAFAAFLSVLSDRLSVSIADKPLLSLDEAAKLTGISKQRLTDEAKAERLKALKPGTIARGWRIKRADLDSYIGKLK